MYTPSETFRARIKTTVEELSLHESKWNSEAWKSVWGDITQEALNDAFNQHGLVRAVFSDLGEITQRNCKSLERVKKKMTEQPPVPGRENYFKVVSDFVAVRVPCEVSEIQGKIDLIRQVVLANDGMMHIKGASNERPYGFFMTPEQKFSDITQYVYVFLAKVGYPVELQIGHKFASHTFTIDSELRDNSTCGKIDLWKNNFYGDVKKHLLDKANGEPTGSKELLLTKAAELHQGNIPEDLGMILAEI